MSTRENDRKLLERSVVVRLYGVRVPKYDLRKHFSQYGPVDDVITWEIHAVVRFTEKSSVAKALQVQKFAYKKWKFQVKPCYENQNVNQLKNDSRIDDSIKKKLMTAKSVSEQIEFLTQFHLSDEELKEREQVRLLFDKLFKEYFVFSKLYLFGSSKNKLGLTGCDLDMLLALVSKEEDQQVRQYPPESNKTLLKRLTDMIADKSGKITQTDLKSLTLFDVVCLVAVILERQKDCSEIVRVPALHCPIVKFIYNGKVPISCDLSLKNRLSVNNTKLVKLFTSLDSRVGPFFMLIRYWMKSRKIESGKVKRISSYACTLLCTFFLQSINPKILPTLTELRSIECKKRIIAGWNCGFSKDVTKIPISTNTATITELMGQFFCFYMNFDFKSVVLTMCGKLLTRREAALSFPNLQLSSVNLQDPFNLDYNITSNLNEELREKLVKSLTKAHEIFTRKGFLVKTSSLNGWGLLNLLEEAESHVSNSDLRGMKRSLEIKQQQLGRSFTQDRFLILSPDEVSRLLPFCPTSSNNETISHEVSFVFICQAVDRIFSRALKFNCKSPCSMKRDSKSSVLTTQEQSQSSKEFKDAKKNVKRIKTSNDEDKQLKLQATNVEVTTYYDTWSNRNADELNADSSEDIQSILGRESRISDHMIGLKKKENPLSKFEFSLEMVSSFDVYLILKSEFRDRDLTSTIFAFLKQFVPNILTEMNLTGNYF